MNISLPLIAGLLLAGAAALPARTFTSLKGQIMEGEIQDANDREVTIKRASDGRDFKVPTASLSAADQKEIDGWRQARALTRLSVSAVKDKASPNTSIGRGSGSVGREQEWSWIITVKNGSAHPVRGLTLGWHQIVERTDRNQGGVAGRAKFVVRRSGGTLPVPDIPAFGTVRFRTELIVVEALNYITSSARATNGNRVVKMTGYKWDESLSGLHVTLLKGKEQVHVWKTGTDTGL